MTRDEVIAGLMAAGSDAATPEKYLRFFAEATTLLTVDVAARAVKEIGPDGLSSNARAASPPEVSKGQDSAATIAAAQSRIAELEAALKPFVEAWKLYADDGWPGGASIDEMEELIVFDLRRAALAVSAGEK